ncbi:MAG: alpha-glucosidase [Chitinophaga sp.]|nr:alpha-glucosidase [Chitinophaga sp.]
MYSMRIICILFFLSVFIIGNAQQSVTLYSPNKVISVQVVLNQSGEISYSIYHKNDLVVEPSKLGIKRKDADFTTNLKWINSSKEKRINESYTLLHGKKKYCQYQANENVLNLVNPSGKKMQIIFRTSNDGLDFRYAFKGGRDTVLQILQETTQFNFKDKATAFLQPNMESKTGWNKTQPSYEEQYKVEIPITTSAPNQSGWVLPALFKSDQYWIGITESAVDTNYCGSRLAQHSPEGIYTIGFPQSTEGIGNEAVYPTSYLPWFTPWRIITLSDQLSTIVESTHGTDLALPAAYNVENWLKPGKASWSWIMFKDGSINYDMQIRYIDFASTMNWEYCLIDVNWDRRIGYQRMRELAEYAATKRVKLLLWYNSAGNWNTVNFYTPRNKLLTHEARMKEFKILQEMGIGGIKVDFFPGDGQSSMKYYIDILKDAAQFKLAVNFHGSTYPRGWSRTYPNLVTMEAIKGQEFVTFNQQDANMQPVHCTLLPFTRNAFDPMDFTPVNLSGIPGINRKTTNGFELALSIIFLSGVQHFAESDSGMLKQPSFVIDYLKELPSTWEEVKFIDGYPGKYVVIARRSGSDWYIAGINGQNNHQSISLNLAALKLPIKKGWMIIDEIANNQLIKKEINLDLTQKIEMKPNGGFVFKIGSL